jgi:carbonic anhydrase
MRNLIALFACSCVALSASANDPAPAAAAKLAASVSKPASASLPAASQGASIETGRRKPRPSLPAKELAPAKKDIGQEGRARRPPSKTKKRPKSPCRKDRRAPGRAARAPAGARQRGRAREEGRGYQAPRGREGRRRRAAILAAAPKHGTVWSYEGELGPANWSKINVDWAKCGMGNRQSPIDLRDGIKVNLEQIGFDYHPSSFNEVNNGHTIQVTVGGGNFITVGNQTYELQQFHFHRPSEEKHQRQGHGDGDAPRAQERRGQDRDRRRAARARPAARPDADRSGTICRWKSTKWCRRRS